MHATYRAVTKELEAFFFLLENTREGELFWSKFWSLQPAEYVHYGKMTGHTNSNSSGDKISF